MPICAAAKKLQEEIETHGKTELRANMEKNIELRKTLPMDKQPKMSQYEILSAIRVEDEEIHEFTDPRKWTEYFPPRGVSDLKALGVMVDWRRSFITTDINPYYDSFVRWQFDRLYSKDFIKFGKRPSIYCIKDKQMCADHDRSEGEGVGPQEYTLIKMEVIDKTKDCFESLKDRNVFLVAATLRPETMYGQTNCYILPDGDYGAFEAKNGEVWICSERSAKNMSYQELLKEEFKVEKICMFKGTDLLGLALKTPLATYEKIYT